jgi:diguanylate cyclase (GGDEF)-like protein
MNTFRELFRIPTDNPALMRSQFEAYTKKIPLLYSIIVINTISVAFTFHSVAPIWLTVVWPFILTLACLARIWKWTKWRGRAVSEAVVFQQLKRTVALSVVLGIVFVGWGFALYPYGDAYAQGHIAFYMGTAAVSSTFCLMHLRPAALLVTGIVVIPFTIFFVATEQPAFIAMSFNLLLVSAAMIYVMLIYSREFASMIGFQNELIVKQRETQRLYTENFRLANRDTLTDLPNRRQFFSNLEAMLERAARNNRRFIVGLIDLDGFKPVNDVYGHVIGDKVLVEAGRRFQDIADSTMFFARLGGDEFGVLIDADLMDTEIRAIGERICAALQAPFLLPGVVAQIAGSVGFATFPEAGSGPELLFERADYALYHAKQHVRGKPVIFSRKHETEIRQFGLIDQALRHADLDAEMTMYFQPIFNVESGKPVAFEALARWTNPQLGSVPPDVFVRIAERSDLINRLTQILLRKSLVAARSWPDDIRVSFNLSMRDLASTEAILNIITIIETSGVAPGRIDLEVTETALMRDFDQANESLRALKRLGVRISLDDFGTGYSSLSYVHRLPLDRIKIDRSFIKDIETEVTCRDIVRTVIDLCRNLNLNCVIEGMETQEQATILRSLGGKMMQGYFFSRPMPGNEVLQFLGAAAAATELRATDAQIADLQATG